MDVKMSEGGRVVVPASLREKYGFAVGDTLVWQEDADGLRLVSFREHVRRVQKMLAKYKRPGESVVDEFIAERRAEAARE